MNFTDYSCFCVYMHQNPETKEIFYIGKGTPSRAYEIKARQLEHVQIIETLLKKGYSIWDIVKIYKKDMLNEDALKLERMLIIGHSCKKSPLVNKQCFGGIRRIKKKKPRPKTYKRHRKYKSRCWN